MRLKQSATLFTALSDETRLRIINLLGEGELCVCDLMGVLKEPQSKISRHLAYLRRTSLVESRKKGLWMHYRLAAPTTKIGAALLHVVRESRHELEELQKDVKEFNKCKSGLVACCA